MLHSRKLSAVCFAAAICIVLAVLLCAGLHADAAEGDCYTITVLNANGSEADGENYVISGEYTLYEDAYGQLTNEYGQLVLGYWWENWNDVIGWRITDNSEGQNEIAYLRETIFPLTAADFGYMPGDYTVYAVWNHTLTAEYYSDVYDSYTLIDNTWNMGEAVRQVYCGEYASNTDWGDTITYTLPWAYRDKYCLIGWAEADSSGGQQNVLPAGTCYTIYAGDWSELNTVKQYYAVWDPADWTQVTLVSGGGSLTTSPDFFGSTTDYWAFSEASVYDLQNVYTVYAPSLEDSSVKITLPQAARDGYTFGGWSYGGNIYQAGDTIALTLDETENVFTAIWTKSSAAASSVSVSGSTSQSSGGDTGKTIRLHYVVDGIEDETLAKEITLDSAADEVTVRLPVAQSETGFYWGGWRCNIDEETYQAHGTVVFACDDLGTDITFTAILTPQIISGKQDLEEDTKYYLPNGIWTVDDDETVYSGKQYIYTEESGTYDFYRN